MEIVKKNILSVICGVVILLAIAALFWPISGIVAGAQAQADAREKEFEKLDKLLPQKKQRKLPVVSLDPDAPTTSLDQFPGQKVIETGQTATKAMAEQSAAMMATAVAMNEHPLLVPKALPSPTNKQAFDFRTEYKKRVREFIPREILHATLPPTDKDLDEAEKKLWEEKYVPKLVKQTDVDPATKVETVRYLNEAPITAQFNDEAAKLPEKIRTERAEQFQMYIDETALSVNDRVMSEGDVPPADQIWYAQNALWIEEDVCRAIARLNSIAKNTLDSPVKRLVSLNLSATDASAYVLPTPAAGATPDAPAPPADPNAPIEKKFDRSPTGRVSNSLYDVLQFTLEVNVDARMIPPLLSELSREKYFNAPAKQGEPTAFITVNKFDLASVNKTEALQQGFVYGEAPIVKVSLQCEALLLRKWTTQYMPTEVKKALGIDTAKPATESSTAQAQ